LTPIARISGSFKNKWFINLSNNVIPKNIQCLLQFDSTFLLPSYNAKRNCFEFIRSIENNIKKLGKVVLLEVRNHSISVIEKFVSWKPSNNSINKKLTALLKSIKRFMKNKK